MLITKLERKYKAVHVWFMYYSVLGLYAAFASELIVRIPDKPFYTMVGIATGTIFIGEPSSFSKRRKSGQITLLEPKQSNSI